MKYKNIKTGMVWENDDVEWVVKLIESNDYFELYQEDNLIEEKNNTEGITAYIPKPKKSTKK
jgi:hypothetical protein